MHRHKVGHLGLGYVAACLLKEGHEVRVVDAKTQTLTHEEVLRRVLDFAPHIAGVTAMTHEICYAATLCSGIKRAIPECLTLVGGPHTTALPERTLREFPGIDVAVVGEGEITACEVARGVRLSNIAGIAYRDGERIHRTLTRPFISDLDSIPFPAWHLFPRNAAWPLYAGRGCPFRCAFCQRVLGDRMRLRGVSNVLAEIDAMEEQLGYKGSWFQDETFGVNLKWTHEFLDRLIERNRRREYIWNWKANSRANLADAALYRKMRQAGCGMLDFGVESGSSIILERIRKSITLPQARRAITLARQAGIRTNAFFIIGHPGETWSTAFQTVRAAHFVEADMIAVGVMVPYPGTEIWDLAQKQLYGYKLLSEDWRVYDKYFGNALALRTLSHRQMELIQVLAYLAFYLGGHHWRDLWRFLTRFKAEAATMVRRLAWPSRAHQGRHYGPDKDTPPHPPVIAP
ncbi:MAG: cobalamin B12-binding domain-containing protein [Planctomycetes bacterium]|nr:cobalamin B12-binding domain-containing protein [Planctomycetota bacterium]